MSGEVNVIPTLSKFRGGPVGAFLGGASLEGGGPVKKNTLYVSELLHMILKLVNI